VLNGRKRVIGTLASLALAGTLGMTVTTPAEAKPDIKDVQARVDRLYQDADQATENYNEAKLRLASLKQELSSLEADEQRQDAALATIRKQLKDSMLQQFEGSNLSAVGQVFVSDDPRAFLGQLSTISSYDSLQAGLYKTYATQADALRLRREATEKRASEVATTEKRLATDKKSVEGKLSEAKGLLAKLKDEERRALLSRDSARVPSDVPASGRAAAAIQYAMAQLGDAYVWGATGPSAFDCSGLTMRAWGAAGVSLPHSSRAQYSSGPHVAESDLQPGDLVFFYSPISHVGLYIGNGLVLHAANPSEGVRISPLHSMPYSGAVRPG
jgi:peptidoglycan DL-endopeptidase CwlO